MEVCSVGDRHTQTEKVFFFVFFVGIGLEGLLKASLYSNRS